MTNTRGTGIFAKFGYGKGRTLRMCVGCGQNFKGSTWAFKCFACTKEALGHLRKNLNEAAPELEKVWARNRP